MAAEAGKAGLKSWRKATAYPFCAPDPDSEVAASAAMQNHSRSRALAGSMLQKAMKRGMVLRPHRQDPQRQQSRHTAHFPQSSPAAVRVQRVEFRWCAHQTPAEKRAIASRRFRRMDESETRDPREPNSKDLPATDDVRRHKSRMATSRQKAGISGRSESNATIPVGSAAPSSRAAQARCLPLETARLKQW